MTWTQAQYVERTRSIADAIGSLDWDDIRDVLPALGLAHTREWKRILGANAFYRVGTRTPSQSASGQITLASLDSGSTDTQQRFFRVLWISDGTRLYSEISFNDAPMAVLLGSNCHAYEWYRTDTVIQCSPVSASQAMTVLVNHTPTPIDQLSGTGVAVEFPRDYELVLCYEAAAWLLAKGGRETSSTADFQRLADQIRADMLGDIARDSTTPTWMRPTDSAAVWGG